MNTTLVALCGFVALASCTIQVDGNISANPNGTVDFTQYAGIKIIGTVSADGAPAQPGPIDLAQFAVGLFTKCADRIIVDGEPVLAGYCTPPTGAQLSDCASNLCFAQVYACLSQELLTVAESNSVYEVDTEIFSYFAGYRGEEIRFRLLEGRIINELTEKPITFSYRIPPLGAKQRTLVYIAARAAAREAGILNAEIANETVQGTNGGCLEEMDLQPTDPETNRSVLDYLVHGLGESTNLLAEATRKAASNQSRVAATARSKLNDHAAAQTEAWKAKVNSYSNAVAGILGNISGATLCSGCETDSSAPGVKAAVELLRTTRVGSIFGSDSDQDVAEQARQALQTDLGQVDGPGLDEFLERRKITVSDIALARRYLTNESAALGRVHRPDNTPGLQGPARIHGLSSRALQHPAPYLQFRAMASTQVDRSGYSGRDYAEEGMVQAIDYVRHAVNALLKRVASDPGPGVLSSDQQAALARVSLGASTLVGTQRMHVNIRRLMIAPTVAQVQIDGAREGNPYFLVKGHEGYRCAVEGTIDGAPCVIAEHVVSLTANTFFPAEDDVRGPQDATQLLDFSAQMDSGTLPEGTEVHLIDGSADPGSRYLGGFTVFNETTVTSPILTNSALADAIQQMLKRQPGQCGVTLDPCGDLNLDAKWTPPLENELTEAGGDPSVEDSWRHYLTLARSAADEADRLGEQLVQSGLDMDIRAEAARRSMEEICGGVQNLPDVDGTGCNLGDPLDSGCNVVNRFVREDPGLQSCLPEEMGGGLERGLVSLGSKMCLFRWNKQGFCQCPDGEGTAACRNIACPLKAEQNTETNHDCQELYNAVATPWSDSSDPVNNTVEFILVDKTLGIFESTAGPDNTLVYEDAVQQLDALEALVSAVYPDSQKIQDWLDDPRNAWVNLASLKALSNAVNMDVDFLHHYDVTLNGMLLWTTRVGSSEECPDWPPWSNSAHKVHCVRDGLGPDHYPLWAPANQGESWLNYELGRGGGSQTNFVNERRNWAELVKSKLTWLGALTGEIINRKESGYFYKYNGYDDSTVSYFGEAYAGIPVRQLNVGDWASEPLVCLFSDAFQDSTLTNYLLTQYSFDSEVAPCHIDSNGLNMMRFEYKVDYEGYGDASERIWEFWRSGLPAFLKGEIVNSQQPEWWYYSYYLGFMSMQVEPDPQDFGNAQLSLAETSPSRSLFSEHINKNQDMDHEYAGKLTRKGFVDLLRFAAHLLSRTGGNLAGCDLQNAVQDMPQINDVNDIRRVRDRVQCVANTIHQIGERIIVPKLPLILAQGYKRQGIQGYYPNYQGENLKAILAIESDLQRFSTAASGVQDVLRRVSGQLDTVYLIVKQNGIQKKINSLRTVVGVLSSAMQAVSAMSQPQGWLTGSSALQAAGYGLIMKLQSDVGGLEDELLELQAEQAFNDAMVAIGDRMVDLRGLYNDIAKAYESIQANLTTLDQQENKASEAFANMLFLDSDAAGHVLQVNTVMRRRQNTLRERYLNAWQRAIKLAYIARRSIELRLGVDMSTMRDAMTLVPAPNGWVDTLCSMQGFDYEKLRASQDDDPLLDPALQESDSYSSWYVGDYVRKLEDFMESYNFDFSSSDERDVAVVSLRDDILGAKVDCEVESYNMVSHSGNVGELTPVVAEGETSWRGWTRSTCEPGDTCIVRDSTASVSPPVEVAAGNATSVAMRLRENRYVESTLPDNSIATSRGPGWMNSGYYAQRIGAVTPGNYIISWYDHLPPGISNGVRYKVEVWNAAGETPTLLLTWSDVDEPMEDAWKHRHPFHFELEETTDLEVRIHPSLADHGSTEHAADPASVEYGDVLIWGVQLEWVHPKRCVDINFDPIPCTSESIEPLQIQITGGTNLVTERSCRDLTGEALRKEFSPGCICLNEKNGICPDNAPTSEYKRCYYEYAIALNQDEIDRGTLIPSNNIALSNFNYRQEAFAVNIVGTNVIDCSQPWSTPTCYSNAFIPYTLIHQGADLPIRNWSRDTVNFDLQTARIEHGKGLTAEVVLTNPITSTASQLLSEYWKDGLRGRPLHGTYLLRIWDTPDLDWRKVEDIQLVWRYRYWTQMSESN
jgi:hypothetical protein